ncbi:MAG: AMP-binding protein [Gemmatimonadaceae bacterium]|nr:AMP-binding protein [Gemmatimonadaceae bacterium]
MQAATPIGVGGGLLAITQPWPSMLRTIWGDDQRYVETYFSKWPGRPDLYFAGDGAKRDDDGYFWILGRVDDVLNVAGHRIGTMEVESALVEHPSVAEAAVVGKDHELKGQAIAAFVTLREGFHAESALRDELREFVAEEDRRDRAARRHPLQRRPAEDALGQDHAPAAARHRRGPRAGRHDHAGGPECGGRPEGAVRSAGGVGPRDPCGRRQRSPEVSALSGPGRVGCLAFGHEPSRPTLPRHAVPQKAQ